VDARPGQRRLHPAWWTAILVALIVGLIAMTVGLYSGSFRTFVSVTVISERAGLVMDPGAKVKLRGVEVGRVESIRGRRQPVALNLEIYPDQIKYLPANIEAQIRATTAFGAKFVDLVYPDNPSPQRLAAGAVLHSRNVTPEVNTVFQNVVSLLNQVDPAKLNAVLSALAEGVRGRGNTIGEAITDANQVLLAVNPRMGTVQQDLQSLRGFSDTYGAAAKDILTVLDAAATTSTTISHHASALDALLLNVVGLSRSGITLLAPNKDNVIQAVNVLQPTTDLLFKYNPELTCTLLGAKWFLDNGGAAAAGGNGYSAVLDDGILLGKDMYVYPDNLSVVAAKGGPGGKPGCGSLPDVSKQYPVRQLVTNTGWGTGVDMRPNPGLGHPCWADYLPVTRAIPQPPSIRQCLPGPAPGPIPYPGAPPYGAPEYAPDGTPLYAGVPAPVPPAPAPPATDPASPPQ
jgi:phospholipid/cholesterol/gamma-HCH transport system substrate-binding protein